VGFLIDKAYIMISTKINVDTSELLKAFKLLESQGKLTADNIDKAFNNSLKIEVDSSDFKKIETEATTMFGKLKNNLKGSFDMSQILNFSAGGLVTGAVEKGLSLVAEGFSRAIEKGSEFEKQLNAVGAVTGQSGEALDKIGESALELSKTFGGDANAQLGAFQGILSKFGAQLAETPQYLNEVTKNVNLLAKAGGIDATTAMNSLTDVMMQFGVDVTDGATAAKESARYMNVLAASAQVGSAEITDVSASILQVGVTAKSAGLSLEETNSAIQILAGGGKKGSEAGVALRNSLQYLQKQSGEGEKVLAKMGLTTLQLGKTLGKEGLDNTLKLVGEGLKKLGGQTEQNQAMFQLFGADASAMGILLKGSAGQMDEFTKAMTGTQSGVEQAQVNMQGFSESMSRLKANIDAILIKSFLNIKEVITTVFDAIFIFFNNTVVPFFDTIFNSIGEAFSPLINEVTNLYNQFMSLFDGMGSGIDILSTLKVYWETLGQVIGVVIQIALQPSLLIIRAIVKVYSLLYEGIQFVIDKFKEFTKEGSAVGGIIDWIKEKFFDLLKGIQFVGNYVSRFLEKLGLVGNNVFDGVKDSIAELRNSAKGLTMLELEKEQEKIIRNIIKQQKENKITQEQADKLLDYTKKIKAGATEVAEEEKKTTEEIKNQVDLTKQIADAKAKMQDFLASVQKTNIALGGTTIFGDEETKKIKTISDEIKLLDKQIKNEKDNAGKLAILDKQIVLAKEIENMFGKDFATLEYQTAVAQIKLQTQEAIIKGLEGGIVQADADKFKGFIDKLNKEKYKIEANLDLTPQQASEQLQKANEQVISDLIKSNIIKDKSKLFKAIEILNAEMQTKINDLSNKEFGKTGSGLSALENSRREIEKSILDEQIKNADLLQKRKIDSMEEGFDKEMALLEYNTKKEREEYKGNTEFLLLIDEDYNKKKAEINKKYNKDIFGDIIKSLTDGFSKIDYTSIFKKKETAFDESLNEDRANLLTSLQQNEISYEEYSERLNEIDRNRRETQKEGNSEFIQGLNQTLALSFENSNMLVSNSLSKSFEENSKKLQDLEITSEQFTTNITDNIGVALGGVMLATAQAGLEGRDLLKSLLINTIDAATAMVNAWAGALFVKEMTEKPFGTGALTYAAYMLGANALLGIGRAYVNSFKDGVINLQGAGTSTSDSIPAMLSKGESVINARSTAQNEPYLRFINNGGDMSKLVNMNMNTKNIENLLYTNNELLRSKNFNPSINNVNKFNVSSTSIKVVRGR
jgi:TP901 family phage tail tape measure protein